MVRDPSWAGVAVLALSVFQTVALAYIASRSRRVRQGDGTESDTAE